MKIARMNIEKLRDQLPRSVVRDGIAYGSVEAVLGEATARRFCYVKGYNPRLSTISKLVESGVLPAQEFGLSYADYAALLHGMSRNDIAKIASVKELKMTAYALESIKDGRRKQMNLSTAVSVVRGVEMLRNGEIDDLPKKERSTRYWTTDQTEFLRKNYSDFGLSKSAEHLGMSESAVQTKASRLGLKSGKFNIQEN